MFMETSRELTFWRESSNRHFSVVYSTLGVGEGCSVDYQNRTRFRVTMVAVDARPDVQTACK